MDNQINNRRNFLKKLSAAGALVIGGSGKLVASDLNNPGQMKSSRFITPEGAGLKITGTFLDEISHDIPHQNWGEKEWDRDFQHMKAIGIDTVIMIRSGYRKFITYPSAYLLGKGCYKPSTDLLDLFLRLAEKHQLKFFFRIIRFREILGYRRSILGSRRQ